MRFPKVRGSNLERREYRLPDDFEGELNLVFIAFQQWHQSEVDSWVPLAKQLTAEHAGLYYYELPTIRSMNFLSRAFIDGGMRMGIPDRSAREATITLYLDKQRFRRALELPSEDHIYVLLVDGNGQVLWRTQGRVSDAKAAALQTAVARFFQPIASEESLG